MCNLLSCFRNMEMVFVHYIDSADTELSELRSKSCEHSTNRSATTLRVEDTFCTISLLHILC
jgi:hypothetical protein